MGRDSLPRSCGSGRENQAPDILHRAGESAAERLFFCAEEVLFLCQANRPVCNSFDFRKLARVDAVGMSPPWVVSNFAQNRQSYYGKISQFETHHFVSRTTRRDLMWILAKRLQCRASRAQLKSQLVQRTLALEKLTQQLLKVQDEERRRVARDLHDCAGQTLAAMKMALTDLEKRLHNNLCTSEVLSDLHALADQGLQEIRTTSYLLHPPLLDEIGFTAAAQWYVAGFAKRSGIKAKLDIAPGSERLPIMIETALFRVLQESLTNTHRHSGSSEVSINFHHEEESVVLEIADCGEGIPAELLLRLSEGRAEVGVGLTGMRERLAELNGTLEIVSNSSGTSLRARVPRLVTQHSERCRNYGPVAFPAAAHSMARSAQL
jgi:signal transduction histidine kinase